MTKKLLASLTFILEYLTSHNESISVAESCTGGYLSYLLTSLPGSSQVFLQGFVTYSNTSKSKNLNITLDDIDKLGAVSPEIAIMMAEKVKEISTTNYGIGITGNAGPGITKNSKKVGEVYLAISSDNDSVCFELDIDGTRDQIRQKSGEQAVLLFSNFLKKCTR